MSSQRNAILEALFSGVTPGDDDRSTHHGSVAPDILARVMVDMLPIVTRPNPFKVGDVVQLQPERSIYKYPTEKAHRMGIVSRVFPPKELEGLEHTSNLNAWHANDICILTNPDDGWIELIVDSWRFEKYTGEIA